MQAAESIEVVAVVDLDGMIVSAAPSDDEVESLAASAAGVMTFLAALGADTGLGDTIQASIEYVNGTLLVGPVGSDTFLLVLAPQDAPLGQLRLILRRYKAEIEGWLNGTLVE